MKLTREQKEAIELAIDNNDNVKIIAYAGAGKTSVLKYIAEEFNKQNKRCIYLAFNRNIVDGVKNNMPCNTKVQTFNSLAFENIDTNITSKMNRGFSLGYRNFCNIFELDEDIKFNIEKKVLNDSNMTITTLDLRRIFQIVRKTLYFYLKDDSDEIQDSHIEKAIISICCKRIQEISQESLHAVDEVNQNSLLGFIRDLSEKLWKDYHSPVGQARFKISHDVYLKLYALSGKDISYDVILFDESQDTDKVMLSILKRQPAKIIFVGDPYQQIYDWRGAVNAIEQFEGSEAYLTQSFRFGDEIAKVANVLLEKLGAPKTLKGVDSIQSELDTQTELPEDINVVLCRTNAGLIFIALEYINRYPNKKIYAQLSINVEKIEQWFRKLEEFKKDPKTGKNDEILSNFESFKELEEYCDNFPDDEEISSYVRLYKEGKIDLISKLLKDISLNQNNHDVLFTTVHKSKGMEWEKVLLNDDFHSLSSESELRLMYVAVTRAKNKLYIGRGKNR